MIFPDSHIVLVLYCSVWLILGLLVSFNAKNLQPRPFLSCIWTYYRYGSGYLSSASILTTASQLLSAAILLSVCSGRQVSQQWINELQPKSNNPTPEQVFAPILVKNCSCDATVFPGVFHQPEQFSLWLCLVYVDLPLMCSILFLCHFLLLHIFTDIYGFVLFFGKIYTRQLK